MRRRTDVALVRGLLSLASPAGSGGRLSILVFHRVLAAPDPLFPGEVDAVMFDRICGWLADWFKLLPLDQAVRQLRQGNLPARALAITFDDGYADNHSVALPILQRHGLSATFYITTGFLDGGRMWNDTVIESVRRCIRTGLDLTALALDGLQQLPLDTLEQRRTAIAAIIGRIKYLPVAERLQKVGMLAELSGARLPDDLMMRSEQVRAMHQAGMLICAHTVSHPILARLDAASARREIAQSRQTLERLTDAPITQFAYPNGVPGRDYSEQTTAVVRELGFESAVTTGWGAARGSSDCLQLPRFSPWDRTPLRFAARMARNLWTS